MDFNGKVVIVTGGATGIGFAVAEGFLRHGGKAVVILSRCSYHTATCARRSSSRTTPALAIGGDANASRS